MVLVDTSVWIRYFHGLEPYLFEVSDLLTRDQTAGHELVYGEILIGDRGGLKDFLVTYEQLYQAKMVPHEEVLRLVRKESLHGVGINWIDAHLLASAVAEDLQLWTADRLRHGRQRLRHRLQMNRPVPVAAVDV